VAPQALAGASYITHVFAITFDRYTHQQHPNSLPGMAASVNEQATHSGVKRNKDATVDIPTSGLESEEPQKKKSKTANDISPLEMTAKDTTDDSNHTSGTLINSSSDANTDATATHSASPGPEAVPEVETAAANNTPPAASLQGLPRELRDLIYEFVADTEEIIVLGRRMVEVHRANSAWSLDRYSDGAIALHSLSMTCRQFRDEFRDIQVGGYKPSWVLLVNNFDLKQLQIFSDYIQSEEYLKVVEYEECPEIETCEVDQHEPIYNTGVTLRFQMDDRAVDSARALCKLVYFENGTEPPSLCDESIRDSESPRNNWFGIAEIITEYHHRTTASLDARYSMPLRDAQCIKRMFSKLCSNIEKMPMYNGEGMGERFARHREMPKSLFYMEQCWFEPFYTAVQGMPGAEKYESEELKAKLRRDYYGWE
jgi:hypothetical protein